MPAGSVSALYRPDIVNEEAVVSFIGCYAEPVKPIQYIWCSLYDNHPTDVLGEVKFFYDQPIVLSANPIVQLFIENKNLIVKEVVPSISEEGGMWVLIADFGDTPLNFEEGYSIIIPEGTIVTKDGDVIVNQRNVMTVGDSSIANLEKEGLSICVEKRIVKIRQADKGCIIRLLSLDGHMMHCSKSTGEDVHISVSATGVYLLTIDEKTYIITIK